MKERSSIIFKIISKVFPSHPLSAYERGKQIFSIDITRYFDSLILFQFLSKEKSNFWLTFFCSDSLRFVSELRFACHRVGHRSVSSKAENIPKRRWWASYKIFRKNIIKWVNQILTDYCKWKVPANDHSGGHPSIHVCNVKNFCPSEMNAKAFKALEAYGVTNSVREKKWKDIMNLLQQNIPNTSLLLLLSSSLMLLYVNVWKMMFRFAFFICGVGGCSTKQNKWK